MSFGAIYYITKQDDQRNIDEDNIRMTKYTGEALIVGGSVMSDSIQLE
jgi:hypothetical protein